MDKRFHIKPYTFRGKLLMFLLLCHMDNNFIIKIKYSKVDKQSKQTTKRHSH